MSAHKRILSVKERANGIMQMLSSEDPEIRDEIAKSFPAYNSLLNMHAKTFEEFALLPLARNKGMNCEDILFDYRTVIPPCPYCRADTGIIRKGKYEYLCNACNLKYKANHNSLSSGVKYPSLVWRKLLHCMLEFYSLKRTCEYCDISPNTYYNMRNRIFYAMQLMMDEIKLYGNIQCDNTMVHLSYKGTELQLDVYPEDSPFGAVELAPRKARSRGGTYTNAEKIKNSICIFAAIDDAGHVMTRLVGVGSASAQKLFNAVGTFKFIYSVPEEEPFPLFASKTLRESEKQAGEPTLLIADGESAIKKFADKIGLNFESHVYRRNGKQVRLAKGAHDIQKVNSLHSRLQSYLRRLNYVSSKYIPGFLYMFEFIENTNASEEAIGKLFEILAQPGLGRDPEFFKSLFSTPVAEIGTKTKRVKKERTDDTMPRNQVIAICFYDIIKNKKANTISLPYVAKITGYSEEKIVQLYDEAVSTGKIDEILSASPDLKSLKSISPDHIFYYDEYAKMRSRPISEQIFFRDFVKQMNEKYNRNYNYRSIDYYFRLIVSFGIRSPLPEKIRRNGASECRPEIRERYVAIYKECYRRYTESRAQGEPKTKTQIIHELAEEYKTSESGLQTMMLKGRKLATED